jgi:glycosyltransferase involved in cell wall biosynthesis
MNQKLDRPEPKPLRILVVGMTNSPGGLESFVMSYCEQLTTAKLHFDFLCRFPDCSFAGHIADMGGKIYHITRRSKNPLKFYRQIHAFFREHANEYDVIWDNECMISDLTPLRLAKRCGIPRRIYHSHSVDNADDSLKGHIRELLHRYHRRSLERVATDLWACSQEAARWAYPKSVLDRQTYRIIPNAISIEQYRYDPQVREEYRHLLGLDHAYVIGNVGHLQSIKNQSFLLDAFAAFHRQFHDAVLLLVGEGADRGALEQRARTLKLSEAVRFLGHRGDVPKLLQVMDLFAMPSKFEGLGIAAVEAQVSGLPCLLSDRLPREVRFRENVLFLPLDTVQRWSEAMARIRGQGGTRTDGCASARAAGYDILEEAGHLEALWRSGGKHVSKV